MPRSAWCKGTSDVESDQQRSLQSTILLKIDGCMAVMWKRKHHLTELTLLTIRCRATMKGSEHLIISSKDGARIVGSGVDIWGS